MSNIGEDISVRVILHHDIRIYKIHYKPKSVLLRKTSQEIKNKSAEIY